MVETDEDKGAPTAADLEGELAHLRTHGTHEQVRAAEKLVALAEVAIEWHREKEFRYAALKSLAVVVVSAVSMHRSDRLEGKGALERKSIRFADELRVSSDSHGLDMYISEEYRSYVGTTGRSLYDELRLQFTAIGVKVRACNSVESVPSHARCVHATGSLQSAALQELSLPAAALSRLLFKSSAPC